MTPTVPDTMQAVAIHAPGPPGALQVVEQALPRPRENEVLIRVAAVPETFFTVWYNVFMRCRLMAGETFLRENVLPLLESGRVRPIIHGTFALEDAAAAHELIESSRHMGKIVLTVAAEARETTDND